MNEIEQRKQTEIDKSLDDLAFYLDDLFRIPGVGWRFGLDAVIGLIPNVGDTLTSFASFYILLAGVRYGVPKITLLRMAFNIGVDYLVGSIPVIGDAFDFVWMGLLIQVLYCQSKYTQQLLLVSRLFRI